MTSTDRRTATADAAMRGVPHERAVLLGRAGAAPARPPALQGQRFDPAGGLADANAEMPVMPRGLADYRDGRQFLGNRRRVAALGYHAVVAWSAGRDDLAPSSRTSASAPRPLALKWPTFCVLPIATMIDRHRSCLPAPGAAFATLFHPWKRDKSPAFQASRSPGVLRSQSGRISLVTARRSCHKSSMEGRPQNQ